MGKNLSDEEWDRLLEEQYLKEADLIEEALFSGDDWDDDEEETEEEVHAAYEDLVARLRARGEYREDEDEIKAEATPDVDTEMGVKTETKVETKSETPGEHSVEGVEQIDKVIPMPEEKRCGKSTFRVARVAGFAIVGVLCVFAASLTSEANRNYFINNVRHWTGIEDTRMVLDNDKSNEATKIDEYQAVKNVEEKLEIEVPEFYYKPKGFSFYDYNVDGIGKLAYLEYTYNETIVTLYIQKKDSVRGSTNISWHGEKKTVAILKFGQIPVDIFEVEAEGDDIPSYIAQWNREDVSYQISGKMEKDEFIKLIEKIRFLP